VSWWDPDDPKKKGNRPPWWDDDMFDIEKIQEWIRELMKGMFPFSPEFDEEMKKNLEKGSVRPFIWGFSASTGPDGKMHFRPFGDVQRDPKGRPEIKDHREPLVDVTEEAKEIVVIIELPGVSREEIELNTTENELTVKVESEYRKYYKEIALPSQVVADSAKARFKNGVLEVRLTKEKQKKIEGKNIQVE